MFVPFQWGSSSEIRFIEYFIQFPAAFEVQVVEEDTGALGKPADREPDEDVDDIPADMHGNIQEQLPDTDHADQRQEHDLAGVAVAAQGAGQHLAGAHEPVEGHQQVDHLGPVVQHAGIPVEEAEEELGIQIQRQAHDQHRGNPQHEGDPHTGSDALFFSAADVL